jgi:hypothetical protein
LHPKHGWSSLIECRSFQWMAEKDVSTMKLKIIKHQVSKWKWSYLLYLTDIFKEYATRMQNKLDS